MAIRNRELRKLIKIVAKEENLTLASIEAIVGSPFLFQTTVMREADRKTLKFPSVRIPYWGTFHVPQWRVKKLKKKDEDI